MENLILENISNPEVLEEMYRKDQKAFERAFESVSARITNREVSGFWKARIGYEKERRTDRKVHLRDTVYLVVVCLIAGFLIHIPWIFDFKPAGSSFYEKNAGTIFFFGLTLFGLWTGKDIPAGKMALTLAAFAIPALFINMIPFPVYSQTFTLACVHLPLLMWLVYGMVYGGFKINENSVRVDFIRHNGEMAIMGSMIVLAIFAVAVMTINMFRVIDININDFYTDYILVWGLVCAPVITAYILKSYPDITARIAPVLAAIFTPIVLVTLIVFLASIPFSGQNPYRDRDFLLVFNIMLFAVLAMIIFSVSGTRGRQPGRSRKLILFLLACVAIVINLIALSAIFYRLGGFGITPNRVAITGSNLLIFVNLLLITRHLFSSWSAVADISAVETITGNYLKYYAAWVIVVVFVFPLLFGLR